MRRSRQMCCPTTPWRMRTRRRPARSPRATNREGTMHETEPEQSRPLTREELTKLAGEELPERAAMSLINANVAAPVNAALAANILSDNSVAYASATQNAPIIQKN